MAEIDKMSHLETEVRRRIKNREKARDYVNLWLKKACASETTLPHYSGRLRKFLEYYDANPNEIVEQWKKIRYDYKLRQIFIDEWVENIENYYVELDNNLASLTKLSNIIPVVSFFRHNKIPIAMGKNGNIDIRELKQACVKYHNRDIKREEIRKILEHCSLRDRTFYLLMLETGNRPRTLVKLRYWMIKEDYEANKVPMRIILPSGILKDKVGDRWSFIGEDGFRALKEYLSNRELSDDTVIFAPKKSFAKGEYVVPESFSSIFNRLVVKLKIDKPIRTGKGKWKSKPKSIRLYCLRKYFRNNIRVESGYRKFWQGHSLGTDTHYISRNIEVHRKLYEDAYKNIRIYKPETDITVEALKDKVNSLTKEIEERDRESGETGKDMLALVELTIRDKERRGETEGLETLKKMWKKYKDKV